MRGAPLYTVMVMICVRIIPAYAGSTYGWPYGVDLSEDHPRVCGEHHGLDVSGDALEGSSPRMRGARSLFGQNRTQIGIIPAYAGSTMLSAYRTGDVRDHPRVCGEHSSALP